MAVEDFCFFFEGVKQMFFFVWGGGDFSVFEKKI